jgi:hypothetical protein
MAPEQARDSNAADIRSDIYSLGCTFYHMLAGRPPFSEGGLAERLYKHIASDPPDVRDFNPSVPAGMWTVLRRMLAKHPDDRFQTPTELIQALRSLAEPAPATATDFEEPDSDAETPTPAPGVTLPSLPSSPAAPPRRKRKKTTTADLQTTPDDPDVFGVTPEQRHAASGQFSHATEVMRTGGDPAYAQQLLLSCCKLDPGNLTYRRLLRDVTRQLARGKKAGWLGSLGNLPARGRLRSARKAGDHRMVLEHGEELLCRNPADLATHLEMAAAAEALGLSSLAVWLLEDAHQHNSSAVNILRALAGLYERQKRFPQAIAAWEKVRVLAPDDTEAPGKIKDLSASDTIARGNFRV